MTKYTAEDFRQALSDLAGVDGMGAAVTREALRIAERVTDGKTIENAIADPLFAEHHANWRRAIAIRAALTEQEPSP